MLDKIMETLANEHRRQLLVALLEHNPQAEVQIPEGVRLEDEQLDTLQIEMHHNHLPRLEEAGFIQWDREQHIVVKGPEFERIKPILKMFKENADELPVDWP